MSGQITETNLSEKIFRDPVLRKLLLNWDNLNQVQYRCCEFLADQAEESYYQARRERTLTKV